MSQLPHLQSSPVNIKKSSTEHFASAEPLLASFDYKVLVREMRNQFIGSMPPSSFLKEFLPRLEQEPALPRGYHTLFANLEVGDGFEERFVRVPKYPWFCASVDLFLHTVGTNGRDSGAVPWSGPHRHA